MASGVGLCWEVSSYAKIGPFSLTASPAEEAEWRKSFFADRLAGLEDHARPGHPRTFPPDLIVQVKAFACELPATHGIPLSRWSTGDLVQQVQQSGLVAP
jgi:hypothetical protein